MCRFRGCWCWRADDKAGREAYVCDVLDRPAELPEVFTRWFASRGWAPRAHQLELLRLARTGRSALLIAPTGAGKTLAGFLPTLVELSGSAPSTPIGKKLISTGRGIRRTGGLHTLYISPLKALAVDIARNLERPVAEMGLPIRLETRTGDTPVSKRQRQRRDPPDILLTTPEQLALLLASDDAPFLFGSLKRVILDELHSLVMSKRGDLLSLGLARLFTIAPQLATVGLSATVAEPDDLRRYLVPQQGGEALADLVLAEPGAAPDITMLDTAEKLPWAGHSARHALGEIYALIKRYTMTLVFVNTRSQAESIFQQLWGMNDDNLPIALHHGSLDVGQRRRVEDAMAAGRLRAVVATSSLDLGIDWGEVDLVINVGAPKGASRLLQRIGRANHRMDEPSRGVLVPANRFEVLECRAAIDAVAENAQDTPPLRIGALDVLAQHVLGCACGVPFDADELYAEVKTAAPYAGLTRADFDATIDFVATGGYALKSYERFAKIRQTKDGKWRIAHPRVAQMYRMNVGTIVEADMLKVRLVRSRASKVIPRGGRLLGQVEEYFIETLTPGDTFVFAGEVLKYEALVEDEAYVSRSNDPDPKVPSYEGGKFPLSTYLADRVRGILADHDTWRALPDQVREWLEVQEYRSRLPGMRELLVETFPRAAKYYLICYPFEGRLAHQTLGMLLTRRLERARMRPLGFRGERVCARRLGPARCGVCGRARRALARCAVRPGHARRRSRSLARRVRADEAHLPQLRDHRRADRAALSGRGEEPPPDDDLDRPRLRRAAQAPAGPFAVARGLCGRGLGPARCAPRQRDARAREGAHHPQSARSRLAARRAGDARDRPRDGLRRGLRRAARRGRSGADQGGDELSSCFTAIRKLAYAGGEH